MSKRTALIMMAVSLCLTVPAGANVFGMPGLLISLDFVPIGNIFNAADTGGYGAVDYNYSMGKYEVTTAQYTEFLNAVAATDTYGLYNVYMNSEQTHPTFGIVASYECSSHIVQSGTAGSYTYSVAAEWANRPVTRVGWGDAARFTNWLHNGQPSGAQGPLTTETGAYALDGANDDASLLAVTREASARYMLPTEDEWYKAAYHKNNGNTGDYYTYATSSDTMPLNPAHWSFDWEAEDATTPGPYNAASYISEDYYPGRDGNDYWQSEVDFWDLSESPYGTLSQAGNVSEWTEAVGETSLFPIEDAYMLRGANWDRGYVHLRSDYRIGYVPTVDEAPLNANSRHVGFRVVFIPSGVPGDFDDDGDVDSDDIGDLCANLTGSGVPAGDPKYDLDGDGDADQADMDILIHDLVEITGGDGTGTEYGDFDLDGDIDTTDLTILATNFGVGTTWLEGNANCDLVIDTTDLTILATNFGFVASGAVPEPATLFVLGCGAIGLLRRPRSKIRRGRRA